MRPNANCKAMYRAKWKIYSQSHLTGRIDRIRWADCLSRSASPWKNTSSVEWNLSDRKAVSIEKGNRVRNELIQSFRFCSICRPRGSSEMTSLKGNTTTLKRTIALMLASNKSFASLRGEHLKQYEEWCNERDFTSKEASVRKDHATRDQSLLLKRSHVSWRITTTFTMNCGYWQRQTPNRIVVEMDVVPFHVNCVPRHNECYTIFPLSPHQQNKSSER